MKISDDAKLKLSIAVITFFFSALGGLLVNAFLAGSYVSQIKQNATDTKAVVLSVKQLEQDLKKHEKEDTQRMEDMYVRKETWHEYVEGQKAFMQTLISRLNEISGRLNNR